MGLDLKAAAEALSKKNITQIQVESAYSWASKAIVAYKNFNGKHDIRWFLDAETYFAEALEHAGASELKASQITKEIKDAIEPLRAEAKKHIAKKSFI
jgi:hypothetical protein